MALADKVDNGLNNALKPNLKEFFGHDGKLLMYHGWSDQLIAPRNRINYYKSVQAFRTLSADVIAPPPISNFPIALHYRCRTCLLNKDASRGTVRIARNH